MLKADYAHDLKISVQMMVSCAQMIQQQVESHAPQVGEYARILLENAQDAVRYLQGALDERCASYFSANLRQGNAVDTVRRAVERFLPCAQGKNKRLHFVSGQAEIVFAYDREKLERIALNLLSNALKYARAEIFVRIKRAGGYFELSVEDDGEGFSDEDFGKAYRAQEHGIGLVEARHFAHLHDGLICVWREGGWTCVSATLRMQ